MSRTLSVIAAAIQLTACGGTGRVSASLTAAPFLDTRVRNIEVTFDELRIRDDSSKATPPPGPDDARDGVNGPGWVILCGQPETVDLMALTGGVSISICASAGEPAGHLSALRLHLTSVRLTFTDGSSDQSLAIPGGPSSGLVISTNMDVPPSGTIELKILFDAGASLRQSGGVYSLTPTLRLLP